MPPPNSERISSSRNPPVQKILRVRFETFADSGILQPGQRSLLKEFRQLAVTAEPLEFGIKLDHPPDILAQGVRMRRFSFEVPGEIAGNQDLAGPDIGDRLSPR